MPSQASLRELYRQLEDARLQAEINDAVGRAKEAQREMSDPQYRIQNILREIDAAKGSKPSIENFTVSNVSDLAPLIRKSRKAMKMNQQQFADAAGVGRRFLSELENGKPSLEFDKVLACALAAGIDIIAKPRRPL